jgi:cell division protein ZapA
MTADASRISVRILERGYHVACPPEERAALLDSAEYLNRKMREIRDSGKVVGLDRIAVMAALNIVNELLQSRGRDEGVESDLAVRVKAMRERVESALTHGLQSNGIHGGPHGMRGPDSLAPPAVFDAGLGTSRP